MGDDFTLSDKQIRENRDRAYRKNPPELILVIICVAAVVTGVFFPGDMYDSVFGTELILSNLIRISLAVLGFIFGVRIIVPKHKLTYIVGGIIILAAVILAFSAAPEAMIAFAVGFASMIVSAARPSVLVITAAAVILVEIIRRLYIIFGPRQKASHGEKVLARVSAVLGGLSIFIALLMPLVDRAYPGMAAVILWIVGLICAVSGFVTGVIVKQPSYNTRDWLRLIAAAVGMGILLSCITTIFGFPVLSFMRW